MRFFVDPPWGAPSGVSALYACGVWGRQPPSSGPAKARGMPAGPLVENSGESPEELVNILKNGR